MIDKMDRYTYKAKRKDNNEWVYGCLNYTPTEKPNYEFIIAGITKDSWGNYYEIIPKTLCQCTGLQDFFEHDLVKYKNEETIYEIVWFEKECYFGLKAFNTSCGTRENEMLYYEDIFKYLEKIGNKFDKE